MLVEAKANLATKRSDLGKVRANMVMARVDLALEKQKREVKAIVVEEKLKREAKVAIEGYKASSDFSAEMACTVVVF